MSGSPVEPCASLDTDGDGDHPTQAPNQDRLSMESESTVFFDVSSGKLLVAPVSFDLFSGKDEGRSFAQVTDWTTSEAGGSEDGPFSDGNAVGPGCATSLVWGWVDVPGVRLVGTEGEEGDSSISLGNDAGLQACGSPSADIFELDAMGIESFVDGASEGVVSTGRESVTRGGAISLSFPFSFVMDASHLVEAEDPLLNVLRCFNDIVEG